MLEQAMVPLPGLRLKFCAAVAGPPRMVRLLKALTDFVMQVVQLAWGTTHGPVMVTTRASSRAPLVIEMYVKSIREKSMSPNNNSKNSGTTIANSGNACA